MSRSYKHSPVIKEQSNYNRFFKSYHNSITRRRTRDLLKKMLHSDECLYCYTNPVKVESCEQYQLSDYRFHDFCPSQRPLDFTWKDWFSYRKK